MNAWNYCGKAETRVQEPIQFGVPPAARNVAGDTAARNALIADLGAVEACNQGLFHIEKFKTV